MQVETENKILFWNNDSVFSNWYAPVEFLMKSQVFGNSEAAFIYNKALAFEDTDIAEQVLKTKVQDPKLVKALGRKIKNFNEAQWKLVREECMYQAVLAKFLSSPELRKILVDTGTKTLVEASPVDKIWGIGLAPNDPKALDEKQWQGQNLLGIVLMRVRSLLQLIEKINKGIKETPLEFGKIPEDF